MANNNITNNKNVAFSEDDLMEMGFESSHEWEVTQSIKMSPAKYAGKGVVRVNTLADGTVLRNIAFLSISTGKRKSFKVSKFSPVQPEQGDEIEINRCSLQYCVDEIDGSSVVNVMISK